MTFDQMIAQAREIRSLDPLLHRKLVHLYVEGGPLCQLVRAMLDMKGDLTEAMMGTHMITDDKIRTALGLQGQVLGINNVLGLIHTLMKEPAKDDDNADAA